MGVYYANLSFVQFRTMILIKPNIVYKDTTGMTNHMIAVECTHTNLHSTPYYTHMLYGILNCFHPAVYTHTKFLIKSTVFTQHILLANV